MGFVLPLSKAFEYICIYWDGGKETVWFLLKSSCISNTAVIIRCEVMGTELRSCLSTYNTHMCTCVRIINPLYLFLIYYIKRNFILGRFLSESNSQCINLNFRENFFPGCRWFIEISFKSILKPIFFYSFQYFYKFFTYENDAILFPWTLLYSCFVVDLTSHESHSL